MRKLITALIFIQCGVIVALFFHIYSLLTTPTVHVSLIAKDDMIISPTDKLKHFYEPKPNRTIKDKSVPFLLPYKPTYTINKDSLHERLNYNIKKPEDTYRIITLGDSFTFGLYVDTKKNWTERLEYLLNSSCRKYNRYDVINLGVRGYDVSYSVERFKKTGMKYNADAILWFLQEDDFIMFNEVIDPLKRKYYKEYQKNGELEKSIEYGNYIPQFIQARKDIFEAYDKEKLLATQKAFLGDLDLHFKNTIVYISPAYVRKNIKEIIKEETEKRKKTYYYSNLPTFDTFPDEHPSNLGHKEITKHVFNYLTSNRIIKCY